MSPEISRSCGELRWLASGNCGVVAAAIAVATRAAHRSEIPHRMRLIVTERLTEDVRNLLHGRVERK